MRVAVVLMSLLLPLSSARYTTRYNTVTPVHSHRGVANTDILLTVLQWEKFLFYYLPLSDP